MLHPEHLVGEKAVEIQSREEIFTGDFKRTMNLGLHGPWLVRTRLDGVTTDTIVWGSDSEEELL
jgi:hypothetical protein